MPTSDNQSKKIKYSRLLNVDPLLKVAEAASLVDASVPTFWRWVAKGIIAPPVKLGGLSRWPESEILAVIEAAKARRRPKR